MMIDLFFTCCVSGNIEYNVKKHIVLIFESLLMIYQTMEPDQENVKALYRKLFDSASSQLQSANMESMKGALLVC